MKLSVISEQTKNDYKKGVKILTSAYLVLAILIAGQIAYLSLAPTPIQLIYPLFIVELYLVLRCFTYNVNLFLYKATIKIADKCPYIRIGEQGILAKFNIGGRTVNRLFAWEGLRKIDGGKANIGFSKTNPKNLEFAFFLPESTRKDPDMLKQSYSNKEEFRKILKEELKSLPPITDEEIVANAVFVELYDEMLAEIRKYWRKDREQ